MNNDIERENKSVGERIRKIRSEQGLTVKQLSEISGIPEKTIYRIETGEVEDPKISSLKPLIKAMNCSADEIFFNKEDYPTSGVLRQLFANVTTLHEARQETILEAIRLMISGSSFEEYASRAMEKQHKDK